MPSQPASVSGSEPPPERLSRRPGVEIRDVTDATTFALLPPCADARFDHRSCDYWEDDVRGAKTARPGWWQDRPSKPRPASPPLRSANPFAPPPRDPAEINPFARSEGAAGDVQAREDLFAVPEFNPFAPAPAVDPDAVTQDAPSKLRLLDRGRAVFGSYAKVLLLPG